MSVHENSEVRVPGHESLIPIRNIPCLLPGRPNGKRLHISACYRWITRGVRGVRLEVIRIGGSTYTSHEALARFAAALSRKESAAVVPEVLPRHRRLQIEEAAYRVKALVGDGQHRKPLSGDRSHADQTSSETT